MTYLAACRFVQVHAGVHNGGLKLHVPHAKFRHSQNIETPESARARPPGAAPWGRIPGPLLAIAQLCLAGPAWACIITVLAALAAGGSESLAA